MISSFEEKRAIWREAMKTCDRLIDLEKKQTAAFEKFTAQLMQEEAKAQEQLQMLDRYLDGCSLQQELDCVVYCQSQLIHHIQTLKKLAKRPDLDIKGLEKAITNYQGQLQVCAQKKKSLNKAIARSEEIKRLKKEKKQKIQEEDERQLLQNNEIHRLQQRLHQLQGNFRIFCKILPPPPSCPTQVISRTSCIEIKLRQDVTVHYATQKGMVSHPTDYTFPPEVSQVQVFRSVKYLLKSVLQGIKCCIFVFGQSGSGKSYTMIGKKGCLNKLQIGDDTGLVPRILEEALLMRDKINEQKGKKVAVTLQFEETGAPPNPNNSIYNFSTLVNHRSLAKDNKDKVKALSLPKNFTPRQQQNQSKIQAEAQDGIASKNKNKSLKKLGQRKKMNDQQPTVIKDLRQGLRVLKDRQKDRKVAQTQNNPNSSRTHFSTILRFIDQSQGEATQIGILTMIDLCGQQKMGASQEKNVTKFIGTSLNEVQNVVRLIRQRKEVNWKSYPLFMCHNQQYLAQSKGIVIVTFSSKQKDEQANKTTMNFIKELNKK